MPKPAPCSSSSPPLLFHPCSPAVPAVWRIHRPPARYHTLRDSRSAPAEPHHRRAARPRADRPRRRRLSPSARVLRRRLLPSTAPYRHHTRASRCTVSLSIFPTHRARPHPVTDVARASNASTRARTVDADDAHPSNASLRASRAARAPSSSRTCCGGACCHPPPPPPGGCIARVVRVTRDDGASDPSWHRRASVYYNTFLHRLKSIRIGGFRAQFGQHAHTHPNPSPARGLHEPTTPRRAADVPTAGRGEAISTRQIARLARTPRAVSSIHRILSIHVDHRGTSPRARIDATRVSASAVRWRAFASDDARVGSSEILSTPRPSAERPSVDADEALDRGRRFYRDCCREIPWVMENTLEGDDDARGSCGVKGDDSRARRGDKAKVTDE